MPKSFKWPIILASVVLSGIGSFFVLRTTIRDLLNKRFGNISYAEIQTTSLAENQIALNHLFSTDLSLTISAGDFNFLVDSALTQLTRKDSVPIPHIKQCSFTGIETSTDKQLIKLGMDFDITLDTLNASLAGSFSGYVSFTVRHDSLILMPAIKTLHLKKLSYEKVSGSDKNILVGFLNTLLLAFMDNVNGYINSRLQGIDISLLKKKIAGEDLVSDLKMKVTLSSPLTITLRDDLAACLIDEDGVHVLATFNRGFGTGNPEKFTSFDNDFQKFQAQFRVANKASFPTMTKGDQTFFVITKKTIASIINNTLGHQVIQTDYRDTLRLQPLDKELVVTSDDLDCSKISYPACPRIGPPPPCPTIHCPQLPCVKILGHRICPLNPPCPNPCQVAYDAALGPIGQQNMQIQAAYDVFKASSLNMCNDLRTSVDVVGGKVDFGKLHIDVGATIGATATISDFYAAEDLSAVSLKLSSSALAPFHVNADVDTKAAGKMICPFKRQHSVEGKASAGISESTLKSSILYAKTNDSTVSLLFDINPVTLDATVTPAPFNELNSALFAAFDCSLFSQKIFNYTLGASMPITQGFVNVLSGDKNNNIVRLILEGKYSITRPLYGINFPIHCKPVKLLQKYIQLNPVVETGYIGFSKN